MSKIPKLPKGQSRPASPEPSPNSLNDNNTPNMQVLQPRSSSLSRSSSLRRSFIRPPKAKLSSSATPSQKSGSPPPANAGPSPAKGLPPSGLPTAVVTTSKPGLPRPGITSGIVPPATSLPPSGLPMLGGVSKGDSPNTKLLSPNPNESDSKLASPKNSLSKSSFSRNSPLRTSRIPRKNSLPPQPNTSTEPAPEKADSVYSDLGEDRTGNFSSPNDSRNSSPTPSNISKIPTVRGSATSSRHCEILKSRRLKYPALWNIGAPNFFSENYDMSGNTSLELLRLGVEELETRVSSLESQMGIQNTELLYNSDDDDSPQDPEEAYLHELTDPLRTSTTSLTSMLGSYSYLKPPLHTSPSTSTTNLMKSPTTSMSNLRSPTSSLSNLRSPSASSTSLSNLRSPLGSMTNLRSPSTSMVSLLKRPESPCRSPEKSLNCNDTTYKSNDRGIKPLSFQRFLSPWADYSEQLDRILNFRKVH